MGPPTDFRNRNPKWGGWFGKQGMGNRATKQHPNPRRFQRILYLDAKKQAWLAEGDAQDRCGTIHRNVCHDLHTWSISKQLTKPLTGW